MLKIKDRISQFLDWIGPPIEKILSLRRVRRGIDVLEKIGIGGVVIGLFQEPYYMSDTVIFGLIFILLSILLDTEK